MKLIRKEGLENTNFRLNDVDISRLFKGRNEISLNLLLRNSQLYASPKGLGFEEHRGRKISQGEGLILQIRNSAKAIIFKESKVLLTKHYYLDGFFYIFPGGGQEHGETLSESVVRECLEEVDEKVVVKQLLHIREYIGKNHEYAEIHEQVHQVEFYFICKLVNDMKEHKNPSNPDSHQVGIEWIDVENLMNYRIYPKSIRKYIIDYSNGINRSVYLGDNN